MKNSIRLLLLLGIGFAVVGKAKAGSQSPTSRRTISVPYTQQGEQVNDAMFSGGDYLRSTALAETLVSSGPTVLFGVYFTTGSVGDYAILRDTDTCVGSSTIVLDRLVFQSSTTAATATYQPGNTRDRIPFPIRFKTGMTIEIVSPGNSSLPATQSATVVYLKQQ